MSATRDPRYQRAVKETAQLIQRGYATLVELEDSDFPDWFKRRQLDVTKAEVVDDVEAALEETTVPDEPEGTPDDGPTRDVADIDWPALWEEFGVDTDDPIGTTRLECMLSASRQTPTDADGEALRKQALADGHLWHFGPFNTKHMFEDGGRDG